MTYVIYEWEPRKSQDNANGCDTSVLQKTEFKKFYQEKIVTEFPSIEVLSLEEPQIRFLGENLRSGSDANKNEKFVESAGNVEIHKEAHFEALSERKKAGSVNKNYFFKFYFFFRIWSFILSSGGR